MNSKNSFILYHSYKKHFAILSNEQKGILLDAIFIYSENGQVVELEPILQMAFNFIREDIDQNKKRWNDMAEARSEAGRRGGVASAKKRWGEESVSKSKQRLAKVSKITVNVNDNVNVNKEKKIIKEKKDAYANFLSSFQRLTGRKFKILTSKTKAQLDSLVANGYTISDWEKAISAALKDKFLTGDNDKGKNYLTPEYISRPNKFEDYLSGAHKPVITGDIRDYFNFETNLP